MRQRCFVFHELLPQPTLLPTQWPTRVFEHHKDRIQRLPRKHEFSWICRPSLSIGNVCALLSRQQNQGFGASGRTPNISILTTHTEW